MKRALRDIIVCPITKQHLLPVSLRLKMILDKALKSDELYYANGELVKGSEVQFLITKNGTTVYSVLTDVPILLEKKQVLVPESKGL